MQTAREQPLDKGHQTLLAHVATPFNEHLIQGAKDNGEILMILARMHDQHVAIEVLVEAYGIYVQDFALTGQYNEDGLDAMQLLAVTQVLLLKYAIEHIYEIGKELQVDDMSESVREI